MALVDLAFMGRFLLARKVSDVPGAGHRNIASRIATQGCRGKKKPPGSPAVCLDSVRWLQLRADLSSAGAVREPKVKAKKVSASHGG
jgi:hypothetical protein